MGLNQLPLNSGFELNFIHLLRLNEYTSFDTNVEFHPGYDAEESLCYMTPSNGAIHL